MASKEEVAKRIVNTHFNVEPGITRIFELVDDPNSENPTDVPLKFLEINADAPPSVGPLTPLYFSAVPGSGIHYPSAILEITPDEFQKIIANQLELPNGWRIGNEYQKDPANGD
ncbi:MAG: hypothetical protein U1D30_25245 [Planctomycetota bacterium]